jgi:hypothetical protein
MCSLSRRQLIVASRILASRSRRSRQFLRYRRPLPSAHDREPVRPSRCGRRDLGPKRQPDTTRRRETPTVLLALNYGDITWAATLRCQSISKSRRGNTHSLRKMQNERTVRVEQALRQVADAGADDSEERHEEVSASTKPGSRNEKRVSNYTHKVAAMAGTRAN